MLVEHQHQNIFGENNQINFLGYFGHRDHCAGYLAFMDKTSGIVIVHVFVEQGLMLVAATAGSIRL